MFTKSLVELKEQALGWTLKNGSHKITSELTCQENCFLCHNQQIGQSESCHQKHWLQELSVFALLQVLPPNIYKASDWTWEFHCGKIQCLHNCLLEETREGKKKVKVWPLISCQCIETLIKRAQKIQIFSILV